MGLLFSNILSIFKKCIYKQAFLFILSFFRHFYINMSIIIQKLHTQSITIQKIYICLFLNTLSIIFRSDSIPVKLVTSNHNHSIFSFFCIIQKKHVQLCNMHHKTLKTRYFLYTFHKNDKISKKSEKNVVKLLKRCQDIVIPNG